MRSIKEVGRWRKKVRKAEKEGRSGGTKVEKEDPKSETLVHQ